MCFEKKHEQITEYPLYLHEDEKGNTEIIGRRGRKVRRVEMGGGMPEGGEPYQQLVTDGEGVAKWEDRLAYEKKYKTVIFGPEGQQWTYVKIADAAPNLTEGDTICYWLNNQTRFSFSVKVFPDYWTMRGLIIATHKPNVSIEGEMTFPEAGLYVDCTENGSDLYITGIAFDPEATEPVITWEGQTSVVKQIDPEFIPDGIVITRDSDGNCTANCDYATFINRARTGNTIPFVIDNINNQWSYYTNIQFGSNYVTLYGYNAVDTVTYYSDGSIAYGAVED